VSRVQIELAASPRRVFQVLEDPRALRILVPGARTIRHFDPRWPDPGTVVHHSVGVAPLVIRDSTEVLECQPPRLLVLEAHVQALGHFEVRFELQPSGSGTTMVVSEQPVRGLAGWPLIRPAVDLAISLRNWELGRRMKNVLQQRAQILGHPLNSE
jgi:uncharacterized protein YndB with AHSA1/START domain